MQENEINLLPATPHDLSSPDRIRAWWQRVRQAGESEQDALMSTAEFLGMEWMELDKTYLAEPGLVQLVPEGFAKNHLLLPLAKEEDGKVRVAVATPFVGTAVSDMEQALEMKVHMVFAPADNLVDALERAYSGEGMEGVFTSLDDDLDSLDDVEDLRDMAQAAPVIRLVNNTFRDAIAQGASDIHISPYEDGLEIRFRVDGILHVVNTVQRKYQAAIISRIKIMSNLDIAERRIPQDGRIRLKMEQSDYDIRVASTPTVFGEGVVMRILDKSSIKVDIADVGFEPEMLEIWKSLVHRPHGAILVTGPTGSGKTTTLYASLNYIKSPELKIITTEDPVEYQLRGIDQIQVNAKVGLTFAAALRSILRQDPDIIMVGEIRDLETAEIAVQSSLTGHLVLSTLHTNDAPTAVTRLVEMGIAPYLVAPTLAGAMAQRLLRRLCSNCKKQGADGKWQAVGCDLCDGSGYKGRLGIFEILVNSPAIQTLIQNEASAAEIGAQARKEGMRNLLQDGLAKAAKGLTTEEEVYRMAQDN
ncbi:GspE/PulE family protein [Maridesulfovibrio sp.]|uniref:GspE/PulE family protein n=1 Tax=Maridesulfovibrio sp. TaxID=2795000 RepID=UPI0029CA7800|nr:GspE/PulE family protein [Maridesulfovibrio sp.]